MQNFNECPQAGIELPENDNGVDSVTSHPVTDETIKITAKIIAYCSHWVTATDTLVTVFLLPAVAGLWFFLLCEQLGELLTAWGVL